MPSLLQLGEDQLVDLALRRQLGGAFKGVTARVGAGAAIPLGAARRTIAEIKAVFIMLRFPGSAHSRTERYRATAPSHQTFLRVQVLQLGVWLNGGAGASSTAVDGVMEWWSDGVME